MNDVFLATVKKTIMPQDGYAGVVGTSVPAKIPGQPDETLDAEGVAGMDEEEEEVEEEEESDSSDDSGGDLSDDEARPRKKSRRAVDRTRWKPSLTYNPFEYRPQITGEATAYKRPKARIASATIGSIKDRTRGMPVHHYVPFSLSSERLF
jgi:hypothetical protein